MNATVNPIHLNYQGNTVRGKKLTVISEMPIRSEDAWNEVQKSSLLEFVTKGMISFEPIGGPFPERWKEEMVVKTKMLLWGFIPFGGIHTLNFVKIDSTNKILLTCEYDSVARMWNHKISIRKLASNTIEYKDEVEIYGGVFTNIITLWAKIFYKYRQKRWLLIAKRIKHENTW